MVLHGFAVGNPHVGKTMLATLAALLVASRVAAAGPEAGERMQLQAALDSARAVRVTGTFGSLILREVRADSLGVAHARWESSPRPALVVSKDVTPPAVPGPISRPLGESGASRAPATMEMGLEINVPQSINAGDRVKIDARIGEFIERARATTDTRDRRQRRPISPAPRSSRP
jgi:hypothetical protein